MEKAARRGITALLAASMVMTMAACSGGGGSSSSALSLSLMVTMPTASQSSIRLSISRDICFVLYVLLP